MTKPFSYLLYLTIAFIIPPPCLYASAGPALRPFATWTNTYIFPQRLNGVAYGNGMYIAVGDYGVVFTSTNAVDWTEGESRSAERLNAIVFTGTEFVAVGGGKELDEPSLVAKSSDGTQWRSKRGDANAAFVSVAYGNGVLVVGTYYGATYLSSDGVSWSEVHGGGGKITFGNGRFVAANYNTMTTSVNGQDWTEPKRVTQDSFETLTYGNGLFVAGGDASKIYRSENGEDWTAQTISEGGGPVGTFLGSGFGNDTFVFTGTGYSNANLLYTSKDAQHWTRAVSPFYDSRSQVFGNGTFVLLGDYAGIATSTNGRDWTVRRPGTIPGVSSIARGPDAYIAVGTEIRWNAPARPSILRSEDGIRWQRVPVPGQGGLTQVIYDGQQFVAVGDANQYVTGLLHSKDGLTWEAAPTEGILPLAGVATGNGKFVAVGLRGTIVTSVDGANWSLSASDATDDLTGVAFGNGTFVAVGGSPFFTSSILLTSSDGVTWTRHDTGPGNKLTGVAFGNDTFVAVRWFGPYLVSTDGLSWTTRDLGGAPSQGSTVTYSALGRVQYLDGWFIAGIWTSGPNWISADLQTWQLDVGSSSALARHQDQAVSLSTTVPAMQQTRFLGRPYAISVSASSTTENGEPAVITVRRHGPTGLEMRIPLELGGTAESGTDYLPLSPWAVIPAGKETVELTIQSKTDNQPEGTETVEARVLPGDAYDIAEPGVATVQISDPGIEPRFRPRALEYRADGSFRLVIDMPASGEYVLEASNDLRTWEVLQSLPVGASGLELTVPPESSSERYFRIRSRAQ